jgi:hypothetical protein
LAEFAEVLLMLIEIGDQLRRRRASPYRGVHRDVEAMSKAISVSLS